MPHKDPEARRAANRAANARQRQRKAAEIASRKALWFQANKERRRQQQKTYRDAQRVDDARVLLRALETHISAPTV